MHDIVAPPTETRVARFRRATHALHEELDARISSAGLFSSRERYALFLAFQRRFHGDIDPLYRDLGLAALVADLEERRRLDLIDRDLADLGAAPPAYAGEPVDPSDRAAALGWLYVSEGSSLGAAFLFKDAAALGFGDGFGARHLAPHPEGRGRNWRRFTEAVDRVALDPAEEARAEAGAVAAFARAQAHVEAVLGG